MLGLAWAPEKGPSQRDDTSAWLRVSALDFCGEAGSSYEVQHYSFKAQGCAFGPLSLAQTLAFCKNLSEFRAAPGAKGIELYTAPGDREAHTNATVLMGAYLILSLKWSAQCVTEVMGPAEARRAFECSWAASDDPQDCNMVAADCWAGLEIALQHGWLTDAVLGEDDSLSSWLCHYKSMCAVYDAAWLVPGLLMVSADPTTTVCDPNPITCCSLFPDSVDTDQAEKPHVSPSKTDVPSTCDSNEIPTSCDLSRRTSQALVESESLDIIDVDEDDLVASRTASSPPSPRSSLSQSDAVEDTYSVDTVCKNYGHENNAGYYKHVHSIDRDLKTSNGRPKDFVSFLEGSGVSLIIRTNFVNEPGMTKEYEASELLAYGIAHADVKVEDRRGGLPTVPSIQAALEHTSDYMHGVGDGVLVHCKGGFGRSVTLSCCLLIDRFNIPGAALLAWVRLCRPGAVTTLKQERFLRSFRGRADLHLYLRNGASSGACCSLQ